MPEAISTVGALASSLWPAAAGIAVQERFPSLFMVADPVTGEALGFVWVAPQEDEEGWDGR